MPVRPMTDSEYKLAAGEPVTNYLVLFGATQGFLTHLRVNGLSMSSKSLMPSPFAKVTLPALILGGAVVGGAAGVYFFGDDQFRRMRLSHMLDRTTRTDAQNYIPAEKI